MDSRKVFLDTNIVLDILDAERTSHKDAVSIWKTLVVHGDTIIISEDMLSTIFYIQKDKENTLEFFKLIQKRWEIVSFGYKLISDSIDLSLEKKLDLEDVLQCQCAKENQCNIFITNDKKFYNCGMNVMNSKEFLRESK